MAHSSKGISSWFSKIGRRLFSKPFAEISRTGRIIQTLWDSAQLQAQQRAHYEKVGKMALRGVREGKLSDVSFERMQTKIDRIERILVRQELLLRSYQKRGNIRDVLKEDTNINNKNLDPV